jgi:hypothetical protein
MGGSNHMSEKNIVKNNFNILSKYPIISLLFIGIGAISIRLIFFENDLIYSSDNLLYFKYAIDLSITGESPIILQNDGWPQLASLFFKFLDSENFLEYMNLQSYLTISFSTLTIIPLYYFSKKFVGTSFALICTIFFVFEPRIIQNSLIGTTDPLFILLIVTSLALVVQKNKYLIAISFVTVALASVIRAEGLFLIPALCLMFIYQFKLSRKNIFQCIIFLSITILILLPFSMQRIENSGDDYLVSRIIGSSSTFSEQTENNPDKILLKISNSIYLLVGFLGKLMIPYLLIFVPIGIIIFLRKNDIQKLLIVIPGFFLILPILYAYTIPILDSRYLFPILPILCIFGTFSCEKYFEKLKYKKIILVTIIIIIIFSSILFLIYKGVGSESQKEFLELANIINKNTDVILYTQTPTLTYLEPARLLELKEFPVMSSNYVDVDSPRVIFESYSNIEDFFILMEKNGITHMVYDEEIDNPIIIKEVFGNYEENKKLKKIFDSQENEFDYKIKIFEIKY